MVRTMLSVTAFIWTVVVSEVLSVWSVGAKEGGGENDVDMSTVD